MLDGVADVLDGLRWELPCITQTTQVACTATMTSSSQVFGGTPGTTYLVTLRVRGVVEQNQYTGGSQNGYLYTGGSPDNAGWNVHSLTVSSPAQTYYFNAGTTGVLYCHALDYQVTLPIDGGTLIVATANAMDGQQVRNIDQNEQPIVIPNVPPAPASYDGQFIQTDVMGVATAN